MSETERTKPEELTDIEKAMEWIDDYSCLSVYMSGEYSAHMRKHLTRGVHDTIISALKQKSEAERWIERIKSLCAEQGCELRGEGFEWSDGCAAGRVALSEEILEILEGKAE